MAAPKVIELLQYSSIEKSLHSFFIKSTMFTIEGEEIEHDKHEIPLSLKIRIDNSDEDVNVINWCKIHEKLKISSMKE